MADQAGSSERAPQWAPARLTIYECTLPGCDHIATAADPSQDPASTVVMHRVDEVGPRTFHQMRPVEVMRVADIVGAPGTWPDLPGGRKVDLTPYRVRATPAVVYTEDEVRAREAWFRRQWAENIEQLDAAMRHELAGYFTAEQVRPLWEILHRALTCPYCRGLRRPCWACRGRRIITGPCATPSEQHRQDMMHLLWGWPSA